MKVCQTVNYFLEQGVPVHLFFLFDAFCAQEVVQLAVSISSHDRILHTEFAFDTLPAATAAGVDDARQPADRRTDLGAHLCNRGNRYNRGAASAHPICSSRKTNAVLRACP